MLFIFNKKFLIECDTFDESKRICLLLKDNNIEFKSVTKGKSIIHKIDRIIWFNIYVNKNNYAKAKNLIKLNDTPKAN